MIETITIKQALYGVTAIAIAFVIAVIAGATLWWAVGWTIRTITRAVI